MQEPSEQTLDLAEAPDPFQASNEVSREVINELTETLPWVILVAALGTLAGLAFLAFTGWFGYVATRGDFGGEAPFVFLASLYTIVFLLPSWRLWRLGTFISRLRRFRTMDDFERTLRAQRHFWRLAGIIGILLLVVMFIAILGDFVFAHSTTFPP